MADVPLQRTIVVGEDAAAAQQRFSAFFTSWLAQGRYQLVAQAPGQLTYARRGFHGWQIIVAILLFPIGLLALLAEKRTTQIHIAFYQDDATTQIVFGGAIPPKAAMQLAQRVNAFDPAVA